MDSSVEDLKSSLVTRSEGVSVTHPRLRYRRIQGILNYELIADYFLRVKRFLAADVGSDFSINSRHAASVNACTSVDLGIR